jgi:hypothetical protein
MADNLLYNQPGSGPSVATDEVSGAHYQRFKLDGGGDGISVPLTGTVQFGLLVDVSRIQASVTVLQGTSPWTVQGQVASLGSLAGQNPVAIGINSDGGTVRFATGVNSTASTTGAAILSVGAMVRAGDGNWYRPLGDTEGRQYVNQGIGNAAQSPWAVSGNVGLAGGVLSTSNSTTATLAASGIFTGTSEDVRHYDSIIVTIFSLHSSFPTGGVQIQFSADSSNWDITETYSYTASGGFSVCFRPKAQFFRVVYQNGVVAQTVFRLETIFTSTGFRSDPNDVNGRLTVNGVSYPLKWQAINATGAGDNTVVAAVPGKKLRIVAITFMLANTIQVAFKSGSTTVIPAMQFTKGVVALQLNLMPYGYFMETNLGEAFVMNFSGNATGTGFLHYIEVI